MQDKLFHATILNGAALARRERARSLAAAMVCTEGGGSPCGACRDCRKVASGIHPDVIGVERFMEEKDLGGEIKVAAVRALRADAFIKPNEAARKVYLIDRADALNLSAQNALLKLLEEGPAYAAFVLMTDRVGALLETIRSRCSVVSVGGAEAEIRPYDESALGYVDALCEQNELARMAFLSRLECEKPDRAALETFLTDVERLLNAAVIGGVTGEFPCQHARRLSETIARADLLTMAEQVQKAQKMTIYHVGAGHLLGWLGTAGVCI